MQPTTQRAQESGDGPIVGPQSPLSRRERQILDILFRRGPSSAAQVQGELPDPPSYSAVRSLLGVLERKGHVRHERQGARYVYRPAAEPERVRRSALSHLVATFFDDSPEQAMAALLDLSDRHLSSAELDRLSQMIEGARRKREGG
jgi:BlaI family transcriptional regulator, penicillinase repressor